MKKSNLLTGCITAALLISSCNNPNTGSRQQSGGYILKGHITGVPSGMVKLMSYDEADRTSKTVDSITFANDSFELSGRIGVPQMMSLLITPGNWSFQVFVEDTDLTIKADTAGAFYYDYTNYGGDRGAQIKNYTETGSRNWDDWIAYQQDPGQKQYDPLFADLSKKITAEAAKNNLDQEYRYRDQADSVRRLLQTWEKNRIDEYVRKNPSSVAGIYMFNQLYMFSQDMPVTGMESMLGQFKGPAKASIYYQYLADQLAKKKAVSPGSIAPDFTLMKRDSSKFTLSSTRGKYMMIDFWASWCHPCRQAIPHWKEVYKKYHDKGFDMVSVSDDSRWTDWEKAMDQEKMPWTQVCDEFPVKNMPARVGSLYMTTYIPFYVLMDKEGKILVYSGKEEDIDAKLKTIFGG